jgi:hypothetical protein
MGGRTQRKRDAYTDRESWITEVSDSRLATYERLMSSSAAPVRMDGSGRIAQGDYFRDLVQREKARRQGEKA